MWVKFKCLNFYWHIFLAGVIRLFFICYGIYHDNHFTVKYTDIDYKVFTDASQHILNGQSPYDRHTYRYSPLVAILSIPNRLLHPAFGKVLFSIVDLFVALLIRTIVLKTIQQYDSYKNSNTNVLPSDKGDKSNNKIELNRPTLKSIRNRSRKSKHEKNEKKILYKFKSDAEMHADVAAMIWLYNPLTVAIATRGNSDSIAGLLVLLTLYLLQCKQYYFCAGLVHGIAIHLRLYPIIYSLSMYMYLSKFSYYTSNRFQYQQNQINKKTKKELKNAENKLVKERSIVTKGEPNLVVAEPQAPVPERKTIFKKTYLLYLIPNMDQIRLVVGCLTSLGFMTLVFYHFYGYTFLFETYLYHFIRQDVRHNFSLFFYLQYLTAGVKNIGLWQKVLITLPQLVLLVVFSVRYGLNKLSLNFSILTQTITMVTYNTVLTSQYFVWILVVLPLSVWQIKMSIKMAIFWVVVWFGAQLAWLMPAYFLEFHGMNTFLFIWLQSVSFFCASIAILGRLIMNYMPARKVKTA